MKEKANIIVNYTYDDKTRNPSTRCARVEMVDDEYVTFDIGHKDISGHGAFIYTDSRDNYLTIEDFSNSYDLNSGCISKWY